jgi:hypothetical protein
MRLLRPTDNGEFSLVEVFGKNIPRYAVLSHTWGADHEEVTFKDIAKSRGKTKVGYNKIRFCEKQAANDGLQFFWVDTCCIDKSSSAELSEAINSMFHWYQKAEKCYVYLADVSVGGSAGSDLSAQQTWKQAFQDTRWFTRGWTLQELLAPTSVGFFSAEGEKLGDKMSLLQEIHKTTRVPIQALQGSPLSEFSVDERISWATNRNTKREEDAAYSLLGIFDIHMPLLYGEGQKKAFSRLRKEIKESSNHQPPAMPPTSTDEAWGEAPGSPRSPTRPPSMRKRQSMQILELQAQLEQLAVQNGSLEDARNRAEETLKAADYQREADSRVVTTAVEPRNRQLYQKNIDTQLGNTLEEHIARLTELNNTLTEANTNLADDANQRYAQLQAEGQQVHDKWQQSARELEALRAQHSQLTHGIESVVRGEIALVLDDRNAEISRLAAELASAKEQILSSKKPNESFLTVRDEDYFDSACQQLCQHVQQWVLRFSKFSDTRSCRLSSEIAADTRLDDATRQKIESRLENAVLDGSNVDMLLADRIRRRDGFMSVAMAIIWEYVFARYLFGVDREQRQKLKSLEKRLLEGG